MKSLFARIDNNPLLTCDSLRPSRDGYKILGVLNPAAVMVDGKTILLLRVAEECVAEPDELAFPYYEKVEGSYKPQILRVSKNDASVDLSDVREVVIEGKKYLSSLSHIRRAVSSDGIHFEIDDEPFIFPEHDYEAFGVEDPRISVIDGTYYINYTAVSKNGFVTALAKTTDFQSVEKCGIIMPPLNKDVCIFESKIKGLYTCIHRPEAGGWGKNSIWIATSPDLIHWGQHSLLLEPLDSIWESEKIGGGAPPIRTDQGDLHMYHASGGEQGYSLSLFLTDIHDPKKVIARSSQPVLIPEMDYEMDGFFKKTVFSNGWFLKNDEVHLYYGACDDKVCLATAPLRELLRSLSL